MLVLLLIIFFLQIGVLVWYLLSYPENKDSKNYLVKFCHISTVCMIGGVAFVFINQFFYGFIVTGPDMQPEGKFGIRDLGEIFKSSKWNSLRTYDLLNEFLFGYFMTLIILLLKDVGRKLK